MNWLLHEVITPAVVGLITYHIFPAMLGLVDAGLEAAWLQVLLWVCRVKACV